MIFLFHFFSSYFTSLSSSSPYSDLPLPFPLFIKFYTFLLLPKIYLLLFFILLFLNSSSFSFSSSSSSSTSFSPILRFLRPLVPLQSPRLSINSGSLLRPLNHRERIFSRRIFISIIIYYPYLHFSSVFPKLY